MWVSLVQDVAVTSLSLPPHLLPSDGRFGSGPSKVRIDSLQHLAATGSALFGTSHRQATIKNVVGSIREGLSSLFGLPEGYEVLLGNGGSTAFWDAASFGLIERRSQHTVHGEFSSKFAAVTTAAPHLEDPDVISVAPPGAATAVPNDTVDVYALIHNETSTGVASPVVRPSSNGLTVVDATSAAGGLAVDPTEFDVYYFAPQKCFGGDGGLWLAACSPAAIERIERLSGSDRWRPTFLDLGIALEQSRLNQTYNTPALGTLALLDDELQWMLEHGGMEFTTKRTASSATTVYQWAEAHELASPFVTDPALRSNVTLTIDFADAVDATALAKQLRANGIVDVDPYRKLGRNQLRIAAFPNIEPDDVAILTQAIDWLIERI